MEPILIKPKTEVKFLESSKFSRIHKCIRIRNPNGGIRGGSFHA